VIWNPIRVECVRAWIMTFPPGTSKWNRIQRQLFSLISQNWRGKPLISHAVIVKLIAATRTKAGLKVRARLDTNSYSEGIIVSQAELENVRLRPGFLPWRLEL